jgi:hypothetical protein
VTCLVVSQHSFGHVQGLTYFSVDKEVPEAIGFSTYYSRSRKDSFGRLCQQEQAHQAVPKKSAITRRGAYLLDLHAYVFLQDDMKV